MTLLGHWYTWVLIGIVWLGLGLITATVLGVIARVGAWRERRGEK
jgi:hypothetical protein